MDQFHTFVCQRVAAAPYLIGEATESEAVDSTSDKSAPCCVGSTRRICNTDVSVEEASGIISRALVASAHPFGVGHLVHQSVWPAFLAVDAAVRQVGSCSHVVDEEAVSLKNQAEQKYSEALIDLKKALDKIKRLVAALEASAYQDVESEVTG